MPSIDHEVRHSTSQVDIRRAEEKDLPAVCAVLTAIMANAKESAHLLDGLHDKEKLFGQMIAAQMSDILRDGEIWIAGEYQGIFAGIYGKNITLWKSLRSGLALNKRLAKTIDKADLALFSANMKKAAGLNNTRWRKKACGSSNYYYIQLIAIDKSLKGRGVFRRLAEPVLTRLEQENIPVLIDTHDKYNVPIYEHFGFELVQEHRAKSGAPIAQYSMMKR